MEPENFSSGPSEEDKTAGKNSGKALNLDEIKIVIARKLHSVAEELSEKAESRELQPVIGDYGKQAADWLDQSAEYIQHFDYHEFDKKVRDYVREKPGASLLIAGVTGLILGALARRR
jgi:ElaB/YqjD/DUF883 family membrane-anchored ribosome-binding protein